MKRAWILTTVWLCFLGCQKEAPNVLPNPAPSEPDEVLFNSTITLTEQGTLKSKIKADRILRYENQAPLFLYHIDALFYDSLKRQQARVTADSGSANEKNQYVELRGHIQVVYSNGTKIDGDSLTWDQANQKVTTEGFVKIIKKDGSVLTGTGLETDPQFKSYRLKNPAGEVRVPEEKNK